MFITDGDCITQQDLAAIDPEVSQLQPALQGPPIVGPESVIRQAVDDCVDEIMARFQTYSGYMMAGGGAAPAIAAVMNTGLASTISRPRMRANQVVALSPDPTKQHMRRWISYRALTFFFRSLFHRKIDDRYERKMDFYEDEAKKAWNRLEWVGLPVCLVPLAAPGALREYQPGFWGQANVTASGSGSAESGNQYDVVITYTGQTYQSYKTTNNAESAPSAIASIQVAAGQFITVNLNNLNPPNGLLPNLGIADGVYSPMAAAGWNVYCGISSQTLCLQNTSPVPIGTTSYTFPGVPAVNSMAVGVGQSADFNYAFVRPFQRG
jgi:hypothetical protein